MRGTVARRLRKAAYSLPAPRVAYAQNFRGVILVVPNCQRGLYLTMKKMYMDHRYAN